MLKDILVHVDGTAASAERLTAAMLLGERDEAHVTGLHVMALEDHLAFINAYDSDIMLKFATERVEVERAKAAEIFTRGLVARAVPHEWREAVGSVDRVLAQHGRYSDLVIIGQNDPANPPLGSSAYVPDTVPLTAGRPVLVIPYAARLKTLGERVLIAWNGSREAARAIGDAMPILRRARQVVVTSIPRHSAGVAKDDVEAADIAGHLARHGIAVEARSDVASGVSPAELLLSLAADLSSDLLVMGAYGHSRLREMVLGGVTRAMLKDMTIPVLMSH